MKELTSDLKFYCWQLQIETLGQLHEFKQNAHATTLEQLVDALKIEFNK